MSKLLVLLSGLLAWQVQAQEEVPAPVWKHQLVSGLNLTQVALKDWSQGGEDALAWTLTLDGKSAYEVPRLDWVSSYKFAFGQTKLGDQGVRKTEDRIDLETTLTYKLNTYVNPYVAATLKTQFARGYQYGESSKTGVSQFFDPGYLTQSAGAGYQPIEAVKTRLGLAVRQIVSRDFNTFTDDEATDKVEKLKVDGGLESVTDAEWKLAENILLTAKLEIFAPLTALDETAVRNDNALLLKVNEYINVNVKMEIVDDVTASDKTQIKEALAVGLTYTFL